MINFTNFNKNFNTAYSQFKTTWPQLYQGTRTGKEAVQDSTNNQPSNEPKKPVATRDNAVDIQRPPILVNNTEQDTCPNQWWSDEDIDVVFKVLNSRNPNYNHNDAESLLNNSVNLSDAVSKAVNSAPIHRSHRIGSRSSNEDYGDYTTHEHGFS